MSRALWALFRSLLATTAVVVGTAGVASAFQGPSPGAATAQTVKVPDGPGSVHGLSDEASVSVFSGQVTYSVPIALPKGPVGFSPGLSLTYSGELGNGPVGIGWSVGAIAIRRSLRRGVPSYTSADELDLTGIGPAGRLVPIGNGEYRVEGQGNRVRVVASGNRFDVTDADGTRYALGVTSGSREEDAGRIAAWFVDSVVNISGQQIAFTYEKDQNEVYLSQVRWAAGGIYRADFVYDGRVDQYTSYRTGFALKCARRLTRIAVSTRFGANSTLLHAYLLSYDASFAVSRLASIRMVGNDDATALPDLTFTYARPELAAITQPTGTGGWILNQRDVSFADVDGDGAEDLLRLEAGNHVYRLNQGDRFGDERPMAGAANVDLGNGRLVDLDGDARPELIQVVDNSWHYYTLADAAWTARGSWPGSQGVPLRESTAVLSDLNGDGRVDVLRAGTSGILVYFNGPSGFAPARSLPPISAGDSSLVPGAANVRFVDVNGDGLADVVWLTDAWMKIFLGRGDGTFALFNRVFYPWGQGLPDPETVQLADLNRDGLMDVVRTSGGYVYWYPGNVDGTLSDKVRHIPRPEGADGDVVITTADGNGNGSVDLVWSSPRGLWVLDLAGPTSAGMLTEIDNGLGKTTQFLYSASSTLAMQAAAQGNAWSQKLPVVVPTVVRVQIDPGAGGLLRVRHFGVRDGFWDGTERRLGGFLQATETTEDADGPLDTLVQETQFHPGLGADRVLRGQVTVSRVENGRGDLFVTTKTDWLALAPTNLANAGPLARRAVTTEVEAAFAEAVSAARITRTTFTNFDAEARATVETHLGLVDQSGDEKVITRSFADDPSYWVRDRTVEETVTDFAGKLAGSTRTYFGAPQGAFLPLGQVGQGFVRQVDRLTHSGGTWLAQATADYDGCGNPQHVYADGVQRLLTYDANCVHAASETVDPGSGATPLVFSTIWDEAHARPETVTDSNADTTRMFYDELDRPIARSVNGLPAHTHFVYAWTAPLPKTTTWVFDGTLADLATEGPTWPSGAHWRQTTAVANGAGEPLYSTTPLGSQFIVSGWTERDERGQVVRTAEPFPAATSTPTVAGTPRIRSTDHDAQGRVRRLTLANGATRDFVYRALGQTVSSSELGPVTSELDGLLRVVHTERNPGAGSVETVDATYDAEDRIVAMSLQGGQVVHTFVYDALGRLVHADDPDVGVRDLVYDDRNFLSQYTNGEHQTTYFNFDGAGRLVRRGDDLTPNAQTDYSYVYDDQAAALRMGCHAASRLAAATEPPQGSVRFCYDVFGRQIGMGRTIVVPDAAPESGTVDDTLSPSGLLLVEAFDDGFSARYDHDEVGRVNSISSGGAALWTADEIDAAGRIVREHYGNGRGQNYTYDQLGMARTITLDAPVGSTPLYDVTVTRNSYGAPTIVVDNDHQGLDHNATFSYDGAGRLTDSTLGNDPQHPEQQFRFSFRYDALQNMTLRTVTGPQDLGVLVGTYRYGERGYGPRQLTSVVPGGSP
jgi:YD repeat-containing protein